MITAAASFWRKGFPSVLVAVGGIVLSGLILEVALRLAGRGPFVSQAPQITSEPGAVLCPHPQLGLALRPGSYTVQINEGLSYHCQRQPDSPRYCGPGPTGAAAPVLALYGCSLTYGMGVDDTTTFAYQLQRALPHWKVRNYGVPAYGTIQSYLQLRQQLAAGVRPTIVLLHYTALHDARNKLSPVQQKYWREAFQKIPLDEVTTWQKARFPHLPKVATSPLDIRWLALADMPQRWTASQHLASSQAIETLVDHIYDSFQAKSLISQRLLCAFAALCREAEIPLLVVGMTQDRATASTLRYARQTGISTLDPAVDLAAAAYNLQPFDSHPNGLAHRAYTRAILRTLRDLQWVSSPSVLPRFSQQEWRK